MQRIREADLFYQELISLFKPNIMKKNKFLAILFLSIGIFSLNSLNSCEEYLDVESLSNTSEKQQFDSAQIPFPLWSEFIMQPWETIPTDRE
jgi:hypothetical protein